MTITIKNMVSTRCILAVKSVLEEMGIAYKKVELGDIETVDQLPSEKLRQFDSKLREIGLEIREDKKSLIVEKIKAAIMELVRNSDEQNKLTLSEYLSRTLNHNSTYLSNLFSETAGMSIEKFFISKKIEHVKRLLIDENLNLKEISYLTNYSSVAHLSYQFKKMTGVAPSEFRLMQTSRDHVLREHAY